MGGEAGGTAAFTLSVSISVADDQFPFKESQHSSHSRYTVLCSLKYFITNIIIVELVIQVFSEIYAMFNNVRNLISLL